MSNANHLYFANIPLINKLCSLLVRTNDVQNTNETILDKCRLFIFIYFTYTFKCINTS